MFQVDGDHLAWPQSTFFDYLVRITRHDSGFRCQNQQSLRCQCIASRTQSVTVESSADKATIAEAKCRWTIPGLNQTCMVFAPCTLVARHFNIVFPGWWNKHLHTMEQVATGMCEQFQHVIQLGRITSSFLQDGQEMMDSISPIWRT